MPVCMCVCVCVAHMCVFIFQIRFLLPCRKLTPSHRRTGNQLRGAQVRCEKRHSTHAGSVKIYILTPASGNQQSFTSQARGAGGWTVNRTNGKLRATRAVDLTGPTRATTYVWLFVGNFKFTIREFTHRRRQTTLQIASNISVTLLRMCETKRLWTPNFRKWLFDTLMLQPPL